MLGGRGRRLGLELGRLREVTLALVLVACGGESSSSPPPSTATGAPSSATPAAEQSAPATGPFDREAARKILAAVDVAHCYEKPPISDAQLHVDLTIMPNGAVSEARADRPYTDTEAGNCAAAAFKAVHVHPFMGPPVRMGRTIPHAPVRGQAESGPFDPSAVRSAALAQDLSECLENPGGGVEHGKAMITVMPNGDVRTVSVDPPLAGSPRGECVARIYKSVQYKPYAGDPAPAVLVEFDIKKKK